MNPIMRKICSLSIHQRRKLLQSLRPSEAAFLINYWPFWARAGQIPPQQDWKIWIIQGDKGTGKTRAAAEHIHDLLTNNLALKVLILSTTKNEAISRTITGSAGLIHRLQPGHGRFYKSEGILTYKNGSTCVIRGCEATLDLASYDIIWCEDIHLWSDISTWSNVINLSLQNSSTRAIITCSSQLPISLGFIEQPTGMILSCLDADRDTVKNYDKTFINAECKVHLPLLNAARVDLLRVQTTPPLKKVVVSVDPSVSPNGCETGIIISGISFAGELFVLGDESLSADPEEWVKVAVKAYQKYHAETLVYENNQGGSVIACLFKTIDPNIQIQAVRASKSKVERLLPLSGLINNQRFHLVGFFPALEAQLTAWMGGGKSPDRLDSLAWGAHSLVWAPM